MANKTSNESGGVAEPDTPEVESASNLGFFVGWVALPGLVVAFIIGLGAHWGARHPDAWFVDAVKWVAAKLFAG